MFAQWSVLLNVWYALLVDVCGLYSQDHYPAFLPVIYGTIGVLIFIHGLMIGRNLRNCIH